MSCQATPRPTYQPLGWECDGNGLVTMLLGPGGVPVVIPRGEVERVMRGPHAVAYDPQPFRGGDHYHLVLPKEQALIHVGPPIDEMVFGMELVLDIDECDLPALTDPRLLTGFAADLVELLDMKAYGPCELWHFGHDDPVAAGYTSEVIGFEGITFRLRQLIETSSIVGHFSPELRRAHLNIFSCRTFDPEQARAFCAERFGGIIKPDRAVLLVR